MTVSVVIEAVQQTTVLSLMRSMSFCLHFAAFVRVEGGTSGTAQPADGEVWLQTNEDFATTLSARHLSQSGARIQRTVSTWRNTLPDGWIDFGGVGAG